MIPQDLVRLPNPEKHLVPSQYALSSRSNRPKSQKWQVTSFLALFSSLIGLSGLILQIMKVLIVPLWILDYVMVFINLLEVF